MKEYELDKSTGEVVWKEDLSKVLELEKMLKNTHLEKYVEQINNDGFRKVKNVEL
jgi:3'-phosphoadenosine 5'-phosphosulfate sulfotransferase